MANLPVVGSNYNTWGTVLNEFLSADHRPDGTHYTRVVVSDYGIDVLVNGGDAVYWDSTANNLKPGLADGSEKQQIIGVISYDKSRVVAFGECDSTAVYVANSDYFLSDSLAGRVTVTKPFTNIVRVGRGLSGSALFVDVDKEPDAFDTSSYTPSRSFGTAYQPDTSNAVFVVVAVRCAITLASGVASIQAKSDASNPPTTVVSTVGIQNGLLNEDNTFGTSFIVKRGHYYKVDKTETNGSVTSVNWIETILEV